MRILISALLLVPAAALASSAFDGTWKGRVGSAKLTGKPDVFQVADGTYSCSSCNPQIKVKADGTDQKVTGHDYYDSVAVKIVDATTVERTNKLAGKVTGKGTFKVSADGSTLSEKFTDYTGAKPAIAAFTEKRVGAAPAGAHAASGSWQQEGMSEGNDAWTTVTYEMKGDHFSMHANGQSYEAKFDGKEYPITGDPGKTVVSLKRVDDNTVVETDRRAGKITDEIRLAAAKDGKTVDVTDKDPVHGTTITYTLEKQQ
ncbi:MAG TPA: hypothetical protein VGD47_05745 [Steroidobacteraceae bacterium]